MVVVRFITGTTTPAGRGARHSAHFSDVNSLSKVHIGQGQDEAATVGRRVVRDGAAAEAESAADGADEGGLSDKHSSHCDACASLSQSHVVHLHL